MSVCSADDNRLAEADCVISDRQLPWRDAPTSVLATGSNVVVASPRHIRDSGLLEPGHLARQSLLACNRTPHLWHQWFEAAGLAWQAVNEIRFDDLAVIIEAALAGQGAALVPEFLVADHIRAGRLRNLFPDHRLGDVQYRLAVQPSHRSRTPVRNFVRWITNAQCAPFDVRRDRELAAIGPHFNAATSRSLNKLQLDAPR